MEKAPAPHVFATTRWTLVVRGAGLADGDPEAGEALAQLCHTYWRPTFAYVCRRGYSSEDAEDLTQDFFLMIMEKNWLQQADQSRGRFRSFLLKSVQHFLTHDTERRRAEKRGGGRHLVPWEDWMSEAAAQQSTADSAWAALSPETFFDLRWATTVVDQALRRLREECEAKGKLRLFEALREHLVVDGDEISYARLASTLSVAETIVKKQLYNLRQRYRWLLRDEVAQTVATPAEVDDEIRYLCATLAAIR